MADLVAALKEAVRGEVRFNPGTRALYATDASNYRRPPLGVVLPRDVADVEAAVAVCRDFGVPLTARGAGTSLAGQGCNEAVVLDFTKYLNRIVELNPEEGWARVQPGLVLDDLRRAAETFGLTFEPDPATHDHCVLGGMIGNNSCGVHALMAGRTSDNVLELDVLTYDGYRFSVGPTPDAEREAIGKGGGRRAEIYRRLARLRDVCGEEVRRRFPRIPRRVSGYNLDELLPENGFHVARALTGTEGTCVIVLEAKVRLVPSPPARVLAVLGYPSVYEAADHVPEILGFHPIGLEGLDRRLVGYMRRKGLRTGDIELLPPGEGWLLVEFGGDSPEEALDRARRLEALGSRRGGPAVSLLPDSRRQERVWKIRESGLGATAFVPGSPDTWPGWEDSAVAPEALGGYLRELDGLFRKYGYDASLYGHFGQGCVHCRIPFDLVSAAGVRAYRSFLEDAVELVVRHGGSLSGEHGDGQARAEFLPRMFGDTLVAAFREFKAIWDPGGKMNPGKVVDPRRADADLRLGARYDPPVPATYFAFPEDGGDFSRAALRCVGVGKCRRKEMGEGESMCPSFLATREEKHTTRGRARLLFEMLQGDVIRGGWRDESVRDALDLCLACKGCKRGCPVNVDMATYKAEFLAHYYQGRLRPRAAYTMGWIHRWARLGALRRRLPGRAPGPDAPPAAGEAFGEPDVLVRRVSPPKGPRRLLPPRATVDPANLASLRILWGLGMELVEERRDELGLPELVYRRRPA